jgi:arabinofuranosyltransferase
MSKKAKQRKIQKESAKAEKLKLRIDRLLPAKPIQSFVGKIVLIASVLLTLMIGIYFVLSSHAQNRYWGFPLDDPWIHLTFAKNLVHYGSFSYFKNEIVTSGSTSPIYTLILALLFIFSSNEFIISYFLGIFFSALSIFFIFKLFSSHFKSLPLLGVSAILVAAIQPKLNLISVSGMETTMFIAFLTMIFFFYRTKNLIWLGVVLGLTVWCRPDGLLIWVAIIIDYFIQTKYLKSHNEQIESAFWSKREFILSFIIAGSLIILYFGFNYVLSGEILPNTYRAKLEYYHNNQPSYFLFNDVIKYFSSKEFIIIWIPFLIGLITALVDLIKKRRNEYYVYFLFVLGFILIYYLMLPFSHRFGRYLMPVIPFYILTSFHGIRIIIDFLLSKKISVGLINLLFSAFALICIILSWKELNNNRIEYIELCQYHNDRHVAAGRWLKQNTLEDDVIATHDIGAIAYYSERKIIDMAGLVTPELITHINDKNYSSFLNNYFAQKKIDYLVTLRNWFEVVNDKPVFVPVKEPEVLEIFKYNPLQTHIQPQEVSQLNQTVIKMLQNGDASQALIYLTQSHDLDNRSSQTFFLFGAAYEMFKDYTKAEQNFNRAVELFPDYVEAYYGLAKISFDQNKIEYSLNYLNRCLTINPSYPPAIQLKDRLTALDGK